MNEPDSRRAWAAAVGAGLANGVGFGTVYTFGAFFDAIAEEFDVGRGPAAVVFALTTLLFFGLGVFSGPLGDRIGPRRLLAVGSICIVIGLLVTSRAGSIGVAYLSAGVGIGLGGGIYVTPTFAAAGRWFVRRRAVALGVVSAGNGLGTLVLVPLAEALIDSRGWRSAYVWLALVDGALLALAWFLLADPPGSAAARPAFGERFALLRELPAFRLMFVSGLLTSISLFSAFAFVVPFATDEGVTADRAALLVGLIGASSIAGRLAIGPATAWKGSVALYQLCLALQPVAYLIWLVSDGSYRLLVAFAVLLGISYGGFVALGTEVTAHLFGINGLGVTLGVLFLSYGIGGLVGPPALGWLSDRTGGTAAPIGAAALITVAAVAVTLALPRDPVLSDA